METNNNVATNTVASPKSANNATIPTFPQRVEVKAKRTLRARTIQEEDTSPEDFSAEWKTAAKAAAFKRTGQADSVLVAQDYEDARSLSSVWDGLANPLVSNNNDDSSATSKAAFTFKTEFLSVVKGKGVCYKCHSHISSQKDMILLHPENKRSDKEIVSVRLNLEKQFRGQLDSVAAKRELESLEAQLKVLGTGDQNHLSRGGDPDASPSDLAARYGWIIDQIQRITVALETGDPTTLTFFEKEVITMELADDIELETGTRLANVFIRCGCLAKELLSDEGKMRSYLSNVSREKPNYHRSASVGETLTYAQVVARPPTVMPMADMVVKESSLRPASNPIDNKVREHAGIPVNTQASNILGVQFLLLLFSLFQAGIKDIKKGPARKLRTLYQNWSDENSFQSTPITEASREHLLDFLKFTNKNPIPLRGFDVGHLKKVDLAKLETMVRLDESSWFVQEYCYARDHLSFVEKVIAGEITESNAINFRMNGKDALAALLQIHERLEVPVNNGKLSDDFEKTLKGLKIYVKGKWEKATQTKSARRTLASLWIEKRALITLCLKYVPLSTQLMAWISRSATLTSMIATANNLGQSSYLDKIHKDNFTVFPMLKRQARLYLKEKSQQTWNEKVTVLERSLTEEQLNKLRVSTKAEGKTQQRRSRKDKPAANTAAPQSTPPTSEDNHFLNFIAGTPQGVCAYYYNGHRCNRKKCELLHTGATNPVAKPRPPRSTPRNVGTSNVPPPPQPSQGIPPSTPQPSNLGADFEERILKRLVDVFQRSQGFNPAVPQGYQQPRSFAQYPGNYIPVY